MPIGLRRRLHELGIPLTLRYQPASRIPDFHLMLACGDFVLGAITVAVVWWLVRRTSLSAG